MCFTDEEKRYFMDKVGIVYPFLTVRDMKNFIAACTRGRNDKDMYSLVSELKDVNQLDEQVSLS